MHHQGKITRTDGLRPFHAQCSCSTGGDFLDKDAALTYLKGHFHNIGVVETSELVDAAGESAPASEEIESKPTPKKKGSKE